MEASLWRGGMDIGTNALVLLCKLRCMLFIAYWALELAPTLEDACTGAGRKDAQL